MSTFGTANVYGEVLESVELPYIKKTGDTATGEIIFDGGIETNVGTATFNGPIIATDNVTLRPTSDLYVNCPSEFADDVTVTGGNFVCDVPATFNDTVTYNQGITFNDEVNFGGVVNLLGTSDVTVSGVFQCDPGSVVSVDSALNVTTVNYPNGSVSNSAFTGFGTAGAYKSPSLTFDANGKITAVTASPTLTAGSYTNSSVTVNASGQISAVSSGSSSSAPVGTIMMWGGKGSTPPAGWLLCNGAIISNTTYSALYAVLGSTYNIAAVPSGQFTLPAFNSRLPMGPSLNNDVMKIEFFNGIGTTTNTYEGSNYIENNDMIPVHTHPITQSGSGTWLDGANATSDCATGGTKSRVYSVSTGTISLASNTQQNTFANTQSMFLPRVCVVNYIIKY